MDEISIIKEYSTLVNSSVILALKKCMWSVEHDDAVQIGWEMLLKCLDKKDDSRGFYAYARLRVYGAVLDESKKSTRLETVNGVQSRVNCTPLEMDSLDESVVEKIVGHHEDIYNNNRLVDLIKYVSCRKGQQILYCRFALGMSMREIHEFIGIGLTKIDTVYRDSISELKLKINLEDVK